MPVILDELRRYMTRVRAALTIAPGDECRGGSVQGLRRGYQVGPLGARDEHAEWLGFADSPETVKVPRGSCDGFAGIDSQP